jgi:hypothetical protein
MQRNPQDYFEISPSIAVAGKATGENGATVDALGYEYATLVIVCGGLAALAAGSLIKVQESTDDSAWSDVSGATYTLDVTDDDNTWIKAQIRMKLRSRYLRAVLTYAGSGTLTLGAGFVLSDNARETDVATRTYVFTV